MTSGDSEDVFEDEEMSSSECNSGEDSGYSQGEAADMFSQESSIKPDKDSKDKKIGDLGASANKNNADS